MTEEKIDFEKHHLVIWKKEGRFHHFQWIENEKHPLEEINADINEWNGKTAEKPDIYDTTVELVTDGLIRDICAHAINKIREKEQEKTDESGKEEARQKIKRAMELLEDAESCLD